ncbi:MAG: pyridoxal phosphate-dependent decarboxylase family protein [Gemmatimonadales bacterium]
MPSPLDLDQDTMRRLGHQVADLVAHHLATLREQPVLGPPLGRREAERLVAGPPPERGREFGELLETLKTKVFPYHAREPHPGFIAYVPSCPSFPAVLGDWLATGFNFFAGAWLVAPGPDALELLVLDWFRGWLGLPPGTGGLLTTGGSAATLTAVVAARHAAVDDDPSRLPRLVLYTSEQTHSSVTRAAWIAGIPRTQVRLLPADRHWRLDLEALATAVRRDRAEGRLPFLVAASAGTTNTGAVDPLPAIAEFCRAERLWFHVDAAYGGFAILTERGKTALRGIELADSVTLDPHKWLFVPFECGCLLARDPERLRAAFRIVPDYMKDAETSGEEVNFTDYGEQLTRYARALKIWLSVSYFGTAVLREAIDAGIDRAEHAERVVRATAGLEVTAPASLGIVCFRAHPTGLDDPAALDALNQRINQRINGGGRYFISSTRIQGAYCLRICTPGFRTTQEDIEGLIREIEGSAK